MSTRLSYLDTHKDQYKGTNHSDCAKYSESPSNQSQTLQKFWRGFYRLSKLRMQSKIAHSACPSSNTAQQARAQLLMAMFYSF